MFNVYLLILLASFIQTVEPITASHSRNGTLFVCMYDNLTSFIILSVYIQWNGKTRNHINILLTIQDYKHEDSYINSNLGSVSYTQNELTQSFPNNVLSDSTEVISKGVKV